MRRFRWSLFWIAALSVASSSSWTVVCDDRLSPVSTAPPCPLGRRIKHTLTLANNGTQLLVFGGLTRMGEPCYTRSDMWAYDTRTKRWSEISLDWRELTSDWVTDPCDPSALTTVPAPRFGHTLTAHNDGTSRATLLLAGGRCHGRNFGDLWTYRPMWDRWTKTRTGIRFPTMPAGVSWNENLYLFGGIVSAEGVEPKVFSNNLTIVPLDGGPVANLAPTPGELWPPARSNHTAVLSGSHMLVFGGQSGSELWAMDDLWDLDLITLRWSSITKAQPSDFWPSPRYGHSAAVCSGASGIPKHDVMVVHGGMNKVMSVFSDLWAFDLGTRKWSVVNNDGRQRVNSAAVCTKKRVWIFGGAERENSVVFSDLVYQDIS